MPNTPAHRPRRTFARRAPCPVLGRDIAPSPGPEPPSPTGPPPTGPPSSGPRHPRGGFRSTVVTLIALLAAAATSVFNALQPASASAEPALDARASAVAADPISRIEWDVLDRVNRFRVAHGRSPLHMAPRVRRVAGARSGSMKRLDYFGHVSPSGVDAGDLLRARRIRSARWGEVIGWTRGKRLRRASAWMVDWWKHSPGHRALLLSRRFDAAGVGVARDGRRILWTIVFVG